MIIVMMLSVSSISIQHMHSFVHCSLHSVGSVVKRGLKSVEIQRDLEMERCIQGTSKTACQLPFLSFFSVFLCQCLRLCLLNPSLPVLVSVSVRHCLWQTVVCLCRCSSLPVLLSVSVRVRHCLCYCLSLSVFVTVCVNVCLRVRHCLCYCLSLSVFVTVCVNVCLCLCSSLPVLLSVSCVRLCLCYCLSLAVLVTACVTVCLCPCSSLPVLLPVSVRVRHCLS